ncbi:MAG: putative peptidoglycan glycosyltransferase FtsW [Chloroflexota bacterium]
MGEQTVVNSRIAAPRGESSVRPIRLGIDVPLVLVVMFLLGFGVLMVYSASWQPSMLAEKPVTYFFLNQLRWVFVGIGAALFFMYVDYRRWKKWLIPMVLVMIVLLIWVALFGEVRFNARRTLFNGSVQPSELAKLVIVIYLAFWLHSKQEVLNNIHFGLIPMITILGLTAGFIMLQPDLSATLTILVLGGMMFFLAGVDWRQIILILLIVGGIGALFLLVSDTGRFRFEQYLVAIQDPANAHDHIKRAIESIVRGGVFGVGIGRGSSKFALPVSHTDSIFAVIAEETGLFGAVAVVIAFMVLMWRGLSIARKALDMQGRLLAAGLTFWITLEAVLNMGVMVSVFPISGNALPLISAGGSNLTMTMAAIGLILSVGRVANRKKNEEEGRAFSAVVNLRRGNGGRGVSRAHRSSHTRR